MKPLVAEVRAVAAALQQEHSDAEEAARAAILALDEARVDRTMFGVAVQASPYPLVYVSFGNTQEALRWVKQHAVDTVGLDVAVLPVFNAERVPKRHLEAMEHLEELKQLEPPKPARWRGR